jgi:hypothetical protein
MARQAGKSHAANEAVAITANAATKCLRLPRTDVVQQITEKAVSIMGTPLCWTIGFLDSP